MEKKIMLGCGCFWGAEAYFKRVNGVLTTQVGYGQGERVNPTYQEVCQGDTGHIEVCVISYDDAQLSTASLLRHFFAIIDPIQTDGQAHDKGPQYMSGIFYFDAEQQQTAQRLKEALQPQFNAPITTAIAPFKNFYSAEEYHQDYLTKNPQGYCHIDISKIHQF